MLIQDAGAGATATPLGQVGNPAVVVLTGADGAAVVTPQELRVLRERQVQGMRTRDFHEQLQEVTGGAGHPLRDVTGQISLRDGLRQEWTTGQPFLFDAGACQAVQDQVSTMDPDTVNPLLPRDLMAIFGLIVFSRTIVSPQGHHVDAMTWGPMVLPGKRAGALFSSWSHTTQHYVSNGLQGAERAYREQASRELYRILARLESSQPLMDGPGHSAPRLEEQFLALAERTRQAYRDCWRQEYALLQQRALAFKEPVFQDDAPRAELIETADSKGLILTLLAIIRLRAEGTLVIRQVNECDGPQWDARRVEVPVWQVSVEAPDAS